MKFARYLDNAQAAEWKRAYIDYRGLKKRIAAIRQVQEGGTEICLDMSPENGPDVLRSRSDTPAHSNNEQASPIEHQEHDGDDDIQDWKQKRSSVEDVREGQIELKELKRGRDGSGKVAVPASVDTPFANKLSMTLARDTQSSPKLEIRQLAVPPSNSRLLGGLRRRPTAQFLQLPSPACSLTLYELLESIPPVQLAFFDKLNHELSKTESFFIAREAEARMRSLQLREQLEELRDHRRLFRDAHSGARRRTSLSFPPAPISDVSKRMNRVLQQPHSLDHMDSKVSTKTQNTSTAGESRTHRPAGGAKLNPDEYIHARKKLKRAVAEHYYGLEVLNNYRILNITGFRKALKKFEKVTGIPVQDVYMKEKVDPCAFASDQTVQVLLKEMEEQFTACFAKGDRKRALRRLRTVSSQKTHHFSTFRTGLALGFAFPAFVDGIVRSFQPHTRIAIPSWGSLLYIYAILLVPTLLASLVGINLLMWNFTRINYVFIFGLDVRTHLDPRGYFELPCIALGTLCWAFWLSFTRVAEPTVQPWAWPVLWLLIVILLMINPLPVMSRESRWWFLRKVARLLMSGFRRVEFADFWLGDQLCSLAFPLSNIYFIACAYVRGFHSDQFQKCNKPVHWGVPFLLAALPFVARFSQSIRRWWDSRLITHLINGGKYLTGIMYFFCYYLWRHKGAGHDASFVFFCLFGIIYSTYASLWDLLMDWSVLRPHARFKFLRQDLIYSRHAMFYYLAIITNVLIRFLWIIYIPTGGPSTPLRSWVVALFEVLRRCQWNMYRLENEHLGNMDQYRITREVPLPYSFDDLSHETDPGDEDDHSQPCESTRSARSRRRKVVR